MLQLQYTCCLQILWISNECLGPRESGERLIALLSESQSHHEVLEYVGLCSADTLCVRPDLRVESAP